MSFTELRDTFGLTTGNAGSHLGRLEGAGYVTSGRILKGLTFELHFRITEEGVRALQRYVREIQTLLALRPAEELAPAQLDSPAQD